MKKIQYLHFLTASVKIINTALHGVPLILFSRNSNIKEEVLSKTLLIESTCSVRNVFIPYKFKMLVFLTLGAHAQRGLR